MEVSNQNNNLVLMRRIIIMHNECILKIYFLWLMSDSANPLKGCIDFGGTLTSRKLRLQERFGSLLIKKNKKYFC